MKVCFIVLSCLVIYLLGLVSSQSCAPKKRLSVEEGESIILQLDLKYLPITSVTWDYEKHIIATTYPGQPVTMGEYSSDYAGRLSSNLHDGSLIIRALSSKDLRIYRAELFNSNNAYICAQLYDLRISGVYGVSPSIQEPSETCTGTKQFSRRLGDDVTLNLPSRSGVAFILWDINNIDHVAITNPGRLNRQNYSFSGRLSAMKDGSLQLSQIITSDERVFRAEVFTDYWKHSCTQLFDVQLRRSRPLAYTPTVKQTNPPEDRYPDYGFNTLPGIHYNTAYTESDTTASTRSYGLQNIIRLALSACILAAALIILLHHIRTECTANQ